ncbi:MAG: hypothetical protein HKP56_13135 [Anderseniella sp.]|nr:hypothetical protein [Anderseniella sp.]
MSSKKQTSSSTKRSEATKVSGSRQSQEQVKQATKKQQLIGLLSGEKLVTVEILSKALDWQTETHG